MVDMDDVIIEDEQQADEQVEINASPGPRPLSRGSISPSRKTISRTGSGRSSSTRPPTSSGHRYYDVRNDDDEENDDDLSDTGYDTDIEISAPKEEYDTTGRASYIAACKQYDVTPVSYFIRHMQDKELVMKHHGLGGAGTKAVSVSLVSNTKLLKLDLTDNWLCNEGGVAIANMLKENCYITHLNLSENVLGLDAIETLCHVIKESNSTITHLNLSGNKLDEETAIPISNMITSTQKLEWIDLSHNNFDNTAGESLGFAISENTSLKEIDLSWNHFRRKGGVNLCKGVGANIFLKRVDLSWNGLALEGAIALRDAILNNNVLEELIISNNRMNVQGAIEIAKALYQNETLRILDIGNNPIESAGAFGVTAALRGNPASVMESVYFTCIQVGRDFLDLEEETKEVHPKLGVHYSDVESVKEPPPKVDPMEKVRVYVKDNDLRMVDFFNEFDANHNLKVTRDEFIIGIKNTGMEMSDEDLESMIKKLDKDGDSMVNYSELLEK